MDILEKKWEVYAIKYAEREVTTNPITVIKLGEIFNAIKIFAIGLLKNLVTMLRALVRITGILNFRLPPSI